MKKIKIPDLKKIKIAINRKVVIPIVVIIALCLVSFSAYHLVYAKKIIPGVYIGNLAVGGMDFDSALLLVQNSFSPTGETINLKADGYLVDIVPSDFDLEYDWYLTVKRAFEIGRSGNFIVDSQKKLIGFIGPIVVDAYYTFDDALLSSRISEIRDEVSTDAVDAGFSVDDRNIVITPSSSGLDISSSDLYKMIINSLDSLTYGERVIALEEVLPDIYEKDLEKVLESAKELVSTDFYIKSDEEEIHLTTEEQSSLVTVSKTRGRINLSLDEDAFEDFLAELKLKINIPPKGKVNAERNGRVLDFEITEMGKYINETKFKEDFAKAFFDRKSGNNFVEVVFHETEAFVDESDYGIYALLGEGNSRYVGSAAGRVHNLTLAAERASGYLVPPGQIFSLSESIGEISVATGYDSAYIITNGRTVLGEGGGVCQTSTTLFRAVLNSGLDVVMRYPHAYRVGYYEQDMQPGFDAAIYQPTIDLRFKNDTSNYVLVQASWDVAAKSLTFKIYGTPDGRTVEISDSVVSNVTPPPEPLYQDDPSLPKGTVKQVDFAAWGANAYFTRKVVRDGEILHDDTFSSSYRPWQAVYLVGTKE